MRILLILICFFTVPRLYATDEINLDSLLVHRHFFQLQRELKSDAYKNLPEFRKLYYQAFLDNFFHELATSNQKIAILLDKYKKQLSNSQISNLLMKKIDNHVKLYEYKQAH